MPDDQPPVSRVLESTSTFDLASAASGSVTIRVGRSIVVTLWARITSECGLCDDLVFSLLHKKTKRQAPQPDLAAAGRRRSGIRAAIYCVCLCVCVCVSVMYVYVCVLYVVYAWVCCVCVYVCCVFVCASLCVFDARDGWSGFLDSPGVLRTPIP